MVNFFFPCKNLCGYYIEYACIKKSYKSMIFDFLKIAVTIEIT